uniref:HMG box domain-containing protein n=1 Tax=Heterorhabditis bacteriophora TaxID=37862 RepID=A0A1I7X0X4_HETBA
MTSQSMTSLIVYLRHSPKFSKNMLVMNDSYLNLVSQKANLFWKALDKRG